MWLQQIDSLSRCAARLDRHANLPKQKKLSQEKLDMVERAIEDGFNKAKSASEATGININSINAYLRILEESGRVTSTSGKNRVKTFEVVYG